MELKRMYDPNNEDGSPKSGEQIIDLEVGVVTPESSTIPNTESYEGTLDLDELINAVMTAHGPRLAAGNYQAAFWGYKDNQRVGEVLVLCDWGSDEEKVGMLAFASLPISAMIADEIIWMADVGAADILADPPAGVTSALLIVSYREKGVYALAFPYTRRDFANPEYEEVRFSGVDIPAGFVDRALRSMFASGEAPKDYIVEKDAEFKAIMDGSNEAPALSSVTDETDADISETEANERKPPPAEYKYLAAALASAWGHRVTFT